MSNQFRNNNGGVAPNKLIIDEQFRNNIQKCFPKKTKKNKFRKPFGRYSQEEAFINIYKQSL